jgi:cell division protein FtsW (lipid II flippase)
VLFAIGAGLGYAAFAHVQQRVDIWLHALDPTKVFSEGYGQVAQAQFGMATGGLVGAGLGRGSPWLIPFASTDFVFAAIGEELGLLGTTAVLLLFVVLVGKGLKTALEATDAFAKLLTAGLSASLGLQTFVIVGGVTRVIPLTGVTLPFVSYGGSSLVSNFVLLALLVRVSSGPAPRRPGALRSGVRDGLASGARSPAAPSERGDRG